MPAEKYSRDFVAFALALKADRTLNLSWSQLAGLFLYDGGPISPRVLIVVCQRDQRGGKKYSPEKKRGENERILELESAGLSDEQIARELGFHSSGVVAQRRFRRKKKEAGE